MWIHPRCLHQWAFIDKMLQTAAEVAAFLLLLSILHCHGKAYYEFLSYTLNATRVFTLSAVFFLGALFLQVCQPYNMDLAGWVPFSFCKGKKFITLGLVVLLAVWLWYDSIASSFSASLADRDDQSMSFHWSWPSNRLPWPWAIQAVHCRSSPTSAQVCGLEESIWEWCHKNLKVSWQTHTPIQYCLFFTHS